jgi:hypothetical protein
MQLKHQHRYLSSLVEKAKLIPIHKSGEMSERGNFRPISILVILSKIIERHVFN